MRRLDDITNSMDMSLNKLWVIVRTEKPSLLRFMGSQESDMTELLNNNNDI